MGTTMILARCTGEETEAHDDDEFYRDANREFWITIEHKTPSELREIAEYRTCPECGSNDWITTDLARNR